MPLASFAPLPPLLTIFFFFPFDFFVCCILAVLGAVSLSLPVSFCPGVWHVCVCARFIVHVVIQFAPFPICLPSS
ncbi:hypothetical protein IOCL2690_000339700 [Leishmania lindenbergi]|uniref:Secreted peptide n=1 Tax=Leishmania lindenbergi TaxID=651832 RepID=A0AAW3AGY8_9TRYP